MTADPLAPTPLEIAFGSVLGEEASEPPLAVRGPVEPPRLALENALRPALERAPCAVTFSGGRDSSLVLSAAVSLARREGFEPPVAVSARFAGAPGTGESEWQELVARHLRLDDWLRVELDDELDLVGSRAATRLRRHGVLHPPHVDLFGLLAERVSCRSLVTGFGGDQVLGGWIGTRESARLPGGAGRVGAVLAYAATPRPLKRRALRADLPDRPWLTVPARRKAHARWLDAASAEPATWTGYLGWIARRRSMASVRRSLELVLGDDVVAVHPLLDRRFLAALATTGGWKGLGGRERLLRLLAGDELPPELVGRQTKAHFQYAYFRGPSRSFARRWDGSGLDPELVDPEPLRRTWLARWPRGSSALALQAAWLAASAGEDSRDAPGGLAQEVDPRRAP